MAGSIQFVLNGAPRSVTPRDDESLLEMLRGRCGIRSLKDGCSPQGQCGCCLALIDGHAKVTCAMNASAAAGHEILTLEGLSAEERDLFARAFAAAAGVQCGFCIPGIALRAKHLLTSNRNPTRAQIARAIDVHLCRCTGYVKIVDAIELMAKGKRGEPIPEPCEDGRLGQPLARYQAIRLALGEQPYVADLVRPGMLHGAVVLSAHARAKVLGIDTAAARSYPGVFAVATAADVPGERWYGLIESDWPGFVAEGEEVRCVGDVLAAVAAVNRWAAREAAKLVRVEYEPLPPVLDPVEALDERAPRVNPKHPNLLSHSVIRRGDADAALAASAHVVSGTWRTQRIEHLYLEPESALAEPAGDDRLRLYTQGQGIFDDRRQVAAFLGIPEEHVDVELVPNGGAFGGKEDMSIQAHAALLARLTGRPVLLTLSRQESVSLHPKRHPITMHYTVGCDAGGRLTAVRARMISDSGAYASVGGKVLERAAGHACGPYRVPNVDVESRAVYTNNPPCGAMRGFGANQAHFAIEGALDLLARETGLDPWEIRWRNALEVGDAFATGQVLEKSVGLKKTLAAVKDRYDEARRQGRAVGIACGIKNSGIGNGADEWGKARLVVEPDLTVSLYNGYTEMGQGLLTVLIQFAAEVTGLPASLFRPKVDSTYQLACGQTTGSRATLFGGLAVKSAAEKLRIELDRGLSLADLVGKVYAADVLVNDTTPLGANVPKIKTHTAFGYATQVCVLDEHGRVDRFVAAHDVGRVVNPALCAGQIEGSIHMGLGYALTEELVCVDGMPTTFNLRELGVLRARDMPEIEVILVEDPEPAGPFGAKGVGEIGLVPTAAAVAGALEEFDGVRRYTLPMKDSPAARAMSVGRAAGGRQLAATTDERRAMSPKPEARDPEPDAGFVNAHTHLYSGLVPLGMPHPVAPPRTFVEILEKIWWRLDRAIDEAALRAAARFYVADALLAGTTAVIDHHESPNFIPGSLDVLADACQELGIRAVLCYGATERNGGRHEAHCGLAECRRFILDNRRPLVRGVVGLHATFTVSDDTIREAGELCRNLGTVLHVHLAEDEVDVEDARRRGYDGPLERLHALGSLPAGSILAHGVRLTREQVRKAADLGCWLVQNPRSNRNNRVGYPHALAASHLVALGTDGFPADMCAELAALIECVQEYGEDPALLEARLSAGERLIAERFGATAGVSAAANGVERPESSAKQLVVGDRMVVRDGRLLTADIEKIRADASEQARRLWTRMRSVDG